MTTFLRNDDAWRRRSGLLRNEGILTEGNLKNVVYLGEDYGLEACGM